MTQEVPEYGVSVQPDSNGDLWMALTIQSASINLLSYLCRADNYEQVAREFHKNIMQAGLDMKREQRKRQSGLVVAKGEGDMNAAVHAERRLKRGQGSAS